MSHVRAKKNGRVMEIIIDRPERRNALAPQTYFELSQILDELEADNDIWLGVLCGAGDKVFSAGRDLKQLAEMSEADEEAKAREQELWAKTTRLTDRFDFSKPLIAKLNGSAYGGGFELALACDLIIAADHIEMALPEPRRGLIAMAGGVHRLPRQIGLKSAMGYLLTGRAISAQRAYELGLVNEVVPSTDLDTVTQAWIDDILQSAPLAVRATKQCVMQGLNRDLPSAMSASYSWEEKRKSSLDAIEGPRAFAQKRKPSWSGE